MSSAFDVIIKNGLCFDGSVANGFSCNIGIRDGKVARIQQASIEESGCPKVIDAEGCWVTPGFIDIHSHYDAEVIASPGLMESVRHGVTTSVLGSCSLSMIVSDPLDCADLFTRVESVPRDEVIPLLQKHKAWSNVSEYRAFMEAHPIGPNIASFIGHSDIRAAVLGLERSASRVKPTEQEMQRMEGILNEALDAGMLGLSVMTTKLDKMDGDRVWSQPLPSTFASWREFGRLFGILRRRSGVMQGAPNAITKVNIFAFLWHATGLLRPSLKMSMLTAIDLKSQPYLHMITRTSGWIANKLLGADFKWQTLPTLFRIYFQGLHLGVLEEFSTGERIMDLFRNPDQAYALAGDVNFRQQLKKEIGEKLTLGVWHRDLRDMVITNCPDQALVGKSMAHVASSRGKDAVDTWLDLCIEFRDTLRCTILLGNHRPVVLQRLLRSDSTHIGFSDSGAHVKNMAFYNFPLRFLKYVRDAELEGRPFMPLAAAIHRLTGELADWFGLETGPIRGDIADIAVINPSGLNKQLNDGAWESMDKFGILRWVNRNDAAIRCTIIRGNVAYEAGKGFADGFGTERRFGRFLRNRHVC